jgi:hypothetical protein
MLAFWSEARDNFDHQLPGSGILRMAFRRVEIACYSSST